MVGKLTAIYANSVSKSLLFLLIFIFSLADRPGRRSVLAAGVIASLVSLINENSASCKSQY